MDSSADRIDVDRIRIRCGSVCKCGQAFSFFPIVPTMCMTSDPYAAGYTFARSAFTGWGPTRDQKAVRTNIIESVDSISRDERDFH